MSLSVDLIHPQAIDLLWHEAKTFLKMASDRSHGEVTVDSTYEDLKNREAQLWIVSDGLEMVAACTTEINQYPEMKGCRFILLGGKDTYLWLDLLIDTVEGWAKSEGCKRLELAGRKGWERDPI